MKNEKNADAVLKELKEVKEIDPLGQLIEEVWQANRRCRKVKILHRALWHLANESCIDILPKREERELYEILHMLNHHQERLEDFLGEATKHCDDLER